MAINLKSLLGVAPLEKLKERNKKMNLNPMEGMKPFGGMQSFNTDLDNQIGQTSEVAMQGFQQPLSSMNQSGPVQAGAPSFYQNQMQNQGLQNSSEMFGFGNNFSTEPDQTGGEQTSDTSGGMMGTLPGGAPDSSSFFTSTSDLFSSFLSGLSPNEADQYKTFLSDFKLDVDEIGALMGFNISDVRTNKDGLRDTLLEMGVVEQFGDYFQGTGEKLRNLQEGRSMMLGDVATGASNEARTLLDMNAQSSTSGLMGGRQGVRQQQARETLEDVLQGQLMGAEGQYVSSLDSLLSGTIDTLKSGLSSARNDLLDANVDLGQYLKGGTGGANEVITAPNYSQQYENFNLNDSQIADVQNYINEYYGTNTAYPSQQQVTDFITDILENQQGGNY